MSGFPVIELHASLYTTYEGNIFLFLDRTITQFQGNTCVPLVGVQKPFPVSLPVPSSLVYSFMKTNNIEMKESELSLFKPAKGA